MKPERKDSLAEDAVSRANGSISKGRLRHKRTLVPARCKYSEGSSRCGFTSQLSYKLNVIVRHELQTRASRGQQRKTYASGTGKGTGGRLRQLGGEV
ncbi:hypothetical protein CA264_05410 [Pontibacter actiniarum]|uniref:Uncharacterized protein n=1 Tax=Pontibacter actiniarum TaxID=323450 RepID=A0A1X9YPZ1_9BACT|nr:hypothetical protein CA264_05410 [Pontibacter actiniarum]